MFDEIRCQAPLPDGFEALDIWFQSKSFPDCCMCRYTITAAGRLIDSLGNDLEPEGYLNFYTTDPVEFERESGGGPSHWREYRARFIDGQLDHIVRVTENTGERRHYGLASFRWFNSPSYLFGDPGEPEDGPSGEPR